MFVRLIACMFCCSLVFAKLAFAQEQANSVLTIEPFPADLAERFLGSYFGNEVFEFSGLEKLAEPSELENNIWRRNKPDLFARVKELRLVFTRKTELSGDSVPSDKTDQAKLDRFELLVKFDGPRVVVRSSKPRDPQYLGGIRLQRSPRQGASAVLEGLDDASISVTIARSQMPELNTLLVCPCRHQGGQGKEISFGASDFTLAEAGFVVEASANAGVSTGYRLGLARASLMTSAGIFLSEEKLNQVVSRDPTISLSYAEPDQPLMRNILNESEILEGIRIVLELKNGAGYKRTSTREESVLLKRVKPSQSISVKTQRGQKSLSAGECIFIAKRQLNAENYSREEPENIAAPNEDLNLETEHP